MDVRDEFRLVSRIPPTPTRLARAEEIFFAAVERPPSERPSFLAAQCAGDPELLDLVERLLRSDAAGRRFLEGTALGSAFVPPAPEQFGSPGPHRRVGPWELERLLGSGGMGHVWLARRVDEHFDQRAAVKILKRGMDTEATLRSFRQERQLLARLEHPNISRLLDGGATDDGLPYFVMEYVDGEPLHSYARRRSLDVAARLRLFREVCGAVAHAHRNLVVHRDLKPSNILVAKDGSPRLLDFGIAKVLDPNRTDRATATLGGHRLTPEYASPEQLRGEPVTTASDVYSLGVILYELLAGRLPWEGLAKSTGDRLRSEQDGLIPRPSQCAAPGGPTDARKVRGDLDNIVGKAMRFRPEERYTSADALSDDLDRYLRRLPIQAKPTTWSYVARRFVQRNRWSTTFVSAALLIVAGAIVLGIDSWWETQQALNEKRDALLLSERETAKLKAVNAFFEELLEGADPALRRRDLTLIDLLKEVSASLDAGRLAAQPELEAVVRTSVGSTYTLVQRAELGEPHLRRAWEIHRARGREETPEACETLAQLARCLSEQAKLQEGIELHRRCLELQDRVDPGNEELRMERLRRYGVALRDAGSHAKAIAVGREALAIAQRLFGTAHRQTAETLLRLGWTLQESGRHTEAEVHLAQALRTYVDLVGKSHPLACEAQLRLGMAVADLGRHEEGEAQIHAAIDLMVANLGEEHPRTTRAMFQYARVLARRKAFPEAESWYRRGHEARHGYDNQDAVLPEWARMRVDAGDTSGAEELLRRYVGGPPPLIPGTSPGRVERAHRDLADLLRESSRFEAAESVLIEGERALEAAGFAESAVHVIEQRVGLYEQWAAVDPAVDLVPRLAAARERIGALRPAGSSEPKRRP